MTTATAPDTSGIDSMIGTLRSELDAATQQRDALARSLAEMYGAEAVDGRNRSKERHAAELQLAESDKLIESLTRRLHSSSSIRRAAEQSMAEAEITKANERREERQVGYVAAIGAALKALAAAVDAAEKVREIARADRDDLWAQQRADDYAKTGAVFAPSLPAVIDPDVLGNELNQSIKAVRYLFKGRGLALPPGLPKE